ncbi:MAG: VIT domain-containing protein, partial [Planctomycetota bacterium]
MTDHPHSDSRDRLSPRDEQLLDALVSGKAASDVPGMTDSPEFATLQETWKLFDQLPPVVPSAKLEKSVLDQVHALIAAKQADAGGADAVDAAPALRAIPAEDNNDHTIAATPTPTPTMSGGRWRIAGPFAAAAALLIGLGIALQTPPPPSTGSTASIAEGGAQPTRETSLHHRRTSDPKLADARAINKSGLPELVMGTRLDPGNPLGAAAPQVPEPMNPPSASASASANASASAVGAAADGRYSIGGKIPDLPEVADVSPPEPMNPPGATASYRYPSQGSEWHSLGGKALASLNAQVHVPAGEQLALTLGASTRLVIDGGHDGAVISLVPDPTTADGVMIEALETTRVVVDRAREAAGAAMVPVSVRTPSALANIASGRVAEIRVDNTSGTTQVASRSQSIEVATFRADGSVMDALVHEGEVATLGLMQQPDVRRHLNTDWIGAWARTVTAEQDLDVEQPLAPGQRGRVASSAGAAVGSLVATDPDHADVPFIIDRCDINIGVRGRIAVATVDEVFVNTTDRTLEGTFWFPLPADASVSSFSMWVTQADGTSKEVKGEWVGREEGRRIYEEYKYARRDPALLEWMEGNTFRMSVFPILPGEHKKLRLSWMQMLTPAADGSSRFVYPLVSEKLRGNPVRHFSLKTSIAGAQTISVPSHRVDATGSLTATNYRPSRDLVIDIAAPSAPTTASADVQAWRANAAEPGYAAIRLMPQFAQLDDAPTGATAGGRRVIVLVDTSGSMADEARWMRQLAVLDRTLRALDDQRDLVTVVTYDAAPSPLFANATGNDRFVLPTDAQCRAIVAGLRTRLRYGATNLGAALRLVWRQLLAPRTDHTVIVLGDGIATQGEVRGPVLATELLTANSTVDSASIRLIPVALGNSINRDMLDALAGAFGSRALLAPDSRPATEVANDISRARTQTLLTDVTVDVTGAAGVSDISPAHLPALANGEALQLVARYAAAGPATITLRGRLHGQPREFSFAINLPADATTTRGGREIGMWWARQTIDALQRQLDANPAEAEAKQLIGRIVELSRTHSVNSRHTSLLVLPDRSEFEKWGIAQTNTLTAALKPADGEPSMQVIRPVPGLRLQPFGSDQWVDFASYVAQYGDRVKLDARLAVPFNADSRRNGEVVVIGPAGERVVLPEKAVFSGLDLPTAAGLLGQWDAKRQPATDNGGNGGNGDNGGNGGNGARLPARYERHIAPATADFRESAARLQPALQAIQALWQDIEADRLRELIRADRAEAERALARMQRAIERLLPDEEERLELADKIGRLRQQAIIPDAHNAPGPGQAASPESGDAVDQWQSLRDELRNLDDQLTELGLSARLETLHRTERELEQDRAALAGRGFFGGPANRTQPTWEQLLPRGSRDLVDNQAHETSRGASASGRAGAVDEARLSGGVGGGGGGAVAGQGGRRPSRTDADGLNVDAGEGDGDDTPADGEEQPEEGSTQPGFRENVAPGSQPRPVPAPAPNPDPGARIGDTPAPQQDPQGQHWGDPGLHRGETPGHEPESATADAPDASPATPSPVTPPQQGQHPDSEVGPGGKPADDPVPPSPPVAAPPADSTTPPAPTTPTAPATPGPPHMQPAEQPGTDNADANSTANGMANPGGDGHGENNAEKEDKKQQAEGKPGNEPAMPATRDLDEIQRKALSEAGEKLFKKFDETIELLAERSKSGTAAPGKDANQDMLDSLKHQELRVELRQASIVPPPVTVELPSQLINRATDTAVAMLRAARGPSVSDVQIAPECSYLLPAWTQARQQTGLLPVSQRLTVFALDCSYTMREPLTAAQIAALDLPPGLAKVVTRKFDVARVELLNAMGELRDDEPFVVLLISRNLHTVTPAGRTAQLVDGMRPVVMRASATT